LAIQRLRLAPKAAVARRVGGVDRLGDDALEAELAGVLQDEFAVAAVMAVELKAGLFATSGSSSALRSMSDKAAMSQPPRCRRSKA
jgi:hypothetical protein